MRRCRTVAGATLCCRMHGRWLPHVVLVSCLDQVFSFASLKLNEAPCLSLIEPSDIQPCTVHSYQIPQQKNNAKAPVDYWNCNQESNQVQSMLLWIKFEGNSGQHCRSMKLPKMNWRFLLCCVHLAQENKTIQIFVQWRMLNYTLPLEFVKGLD